MGEWGRMRVATVRRAPGGHDFVVDRRGRVRRVEKRSGGWAGALMTAAAALGIALTPMPGSDETLIAAGAQAVRNAAEMIRARSPGLRARADLIKTKFERAARPRVARALPRVRGPAPPRPLALLAPPPAPLPVVFNGPDLAPAFPEFLAGPAPVLEEAAPCPCRFGYIPPIPGGGFIVGIGGGGGGGGGVIPPPPGVPEPPDWAAMILGFVLLGSAWRRRRMILAKLRQIPRLFHVRVPLLAYARAR